MQAKYVDLLSPIFAVQNQIDLSFFCSEFRVYVELRILVCDNVLGVILLSLDDFWSLVPRYLRGFSS